MASYWVAAAEEVPLRAMKRVQAGGEEICLAHAEDGEFYAIGDVCTHEYSSLAEGELEGLEVECALHGSRFNLQTGKVTGLPAVIPARTYRAWTEDGGVWVEVDS